MKYSMGICGTNRNFTVINNGIIQDANLSLDAKGLFAYISYVMQFSDKESVSISDLQGCTADSEEQTRAALDELTRNGYLYTY